ncbi:terminase [Brevundimonas sp. S30B]|uniref:terminase large subunit n=1 Tax=unclassified Brevundimonas TaxID=2622653 RepID=UPI0010729550|nr:MULTISPECIES: terminase TerL endonuclease subunit [unclassified Brevundimonas]QBX38660.1 terminase [Brevundimonas sp. MF30-B]TFW01251.1 terminase [Brevundimonas sp. S30B]
MRRTRTSSRSPVAADPTTRWAQDVVAGRIVSGEFGKFAAARHLKDLANSPGNGLFFDVEAAGRALGFFPAVLTVTAGAMEGKPFVPLPWHTFVVGCLFGWKKASGRLRFRRAWLETGKGQAKSPLMAAIGLYMMGWHGTKRSEVYAIGQDRATANVLFKDAVAMCRANLPDTPDDEEDSLVSRGEVLIRGEGDNAWKIEHPDTGSKFQALANGEAISGPRPSLVTADEIHEFKFATSIETWQRAIAKMPGDAMMLLGTNTPASTQLVGTSYSDFFQRVLKGEVIDDEAFAFIARVDKADRETIFDNEAAWVKALPALDLTFPIENIRGEVTSARSMTSTAMSVKRLYFGIPTGAVDFWIEEGAWAAVQGSVDPNDFRGCPCWASLDLSKKNDLTALTVVWIRDGKLYAKTWYWTTKDGLADRERKANAPLAQWVEDGFVEAHPGAVIDKTFVAAQVAEIFDQHDLQFLAFDAAMIEDFIAACEQIGFAVWRWKGPKEPEGEGLKLVAHAQGTRVMFEDRQLCMPRSIERFEDAILNENVVIDNNPVTYFCAGNALVVEDGQKNRAFDKKRSRGWIDGLVTTAMAVGSALSNDQPTEAGWNDYLATLGVPA